MKKKLGAAIYAIRDRRRMSQADLARITDIPQPTISRVESGMRMPGSDLLLYIARGLDITPNEIYREAGVLEICGTVNEARAKYQTVPRMTRFIELLARLDDRQAQFMLDVLERFVALSQQGDG